MLIFEYVKFHTFEIIKVPKKLQVLLHGKLRMKKTGASKFFYDHHKATVYHPFEEYYEIRY